MSCRPYKIWFANLIRLSPIYQTKGGIDGLLTNGNTTMIEYHSLSSNEYINGVYRV